MVFPSIKKKLDLSDTPSRKSKVQFHGDVNAASGSPDSNDSFDLSDATTVKEMVARIETLNFRLAEAKLDLSGEKSLRLKKEKNLVKLAKELNKRSTEAKSKNEEINNLEKKIADFEAKLKLADDNARVHKREINEAEQRYRSICREYEKDLVEARTQREAKCTELRDALHEANMNTECLRARLAVLEGNHWKKEASLGLKQWAQLTCHCLKAWTKKRRIFLIYIFAVAVVGFYVASNPASKGAVCGMARPGTVLSSEEEATMDAPWWAPDPIKDEAFALFCGNQTRNRLVWSAGKLSQFSLANGDGSSSNKPTWQRRAVSVEIGANRAFLMNKHGEVFADIETA